MYNQLPGGFTTRQGHSIAWLFIASLFLAAVALALRYGPSFKNGTATTFPAPQSQSIQLPAAEAEDLLRHLGSASAAQADAAAALERSQHWTERAAIAVPEYQASVLRRLELTRAAQVTAATNNDRAQQELEIARKILTDRRSR